MRFIPRWTNSAKILGGSSRAAAGHGPTVLSRTTGAAASIQRPEGSRHYRGVRWRKARPH